MADRNEMGGRHRFVLSLSAVAILSFILAVPEFRAQQQPSQEPQLKMRTQDQQPAVTVEVKSVSVLATVRDKKGKIVV